MNDLNKVTKLHELLGLAYKHMVAAKKSKDYVFNADIWHTPKGDKCIVCIAGAVMAGELKVPKNKKATPGSFAFDNKTHYLLAALDDLRYKEGFSSLCEAGITMNIIQFQTLFEDLSLKGLNRGYSKTWKALWKRAEGMDI